MNPLHHSAIRPTEQIRRSATISNCGEYRYLLERGNITVDGNPRTMLVIGVNPSTADGLQDDPTVRRIYGFCASLGYGNALVANKFARRSPDVKALRRAGDPVGPENDEHLLHAMRSADIVVAAWGPLAKLPEALRSRWKEVVRIADKAGAELWCLGTAQDGHPRHPLLLTADTELERWPVPWFPLRREIASTPPTEPTERQQWKADNFARQYGQGAAKIQGEGEQ